MLYGENPFFGLDCFQVMKNINEKSGINLPFLDQKNPVSALSKDLLRKVLEKDPDRRLDWEGFFNHPVFNSQHVAQGTGANIDKEFEINKQSVFHVMNKEDFIDPMNHKAEPGNINRIIETPTQINRVVDLEAIYKENEFRYLHEKNKIMMIFLTIKKLRKLMKDPDYVEISKYLYLLISVLAKKGAMLSELTIYSLNVQNDIFKLNNFLEFCTRSRECQEVMSYLTRDREIIRAYVNFLSTIKNEVQLLPDDENLLGWLQNKHVDLPQLDEKAMIYYKQVQNSAKPVKLTFNPEENRKFLLAMFMVLHSIRCEHLLPYTNNGKKFEWESFKARLESMNSDLLREGISIIGF